MERGTCDTGRDFWGSSVREGRLELQRVVAVGLAFFGEELGGGGGNLGGETRAAGYSCYGLVAEGVAVEGVMDRDGRYEGWVGHCGMETHW